MKTLLEVSKLRRSYWDKYKNKCSKDADYKDYLKIVKVFNENRKQFGYRKIDSELRKHGVIINHKKILRIMNKFLIVAEFVRKMQAKSWRSKIVKVNVNEYPDLVNRNFSSVQERFTVLYTDVTYLIYQGQRYYQSTIIDGFTKEIIDFKISKFNDLKLVMENLNSAIEKIKEQKSDLNGVIIHSDHGFQYTSNTYKNRCDIDGIIISMGRAYTCADNVIIESFHSLLKKGTLHNNNYSNIEEYVIDVVDWNHWYNKTKLRDFGIS